MTNLKKFTLDHNDKKNRWELKDENADRARKSFETKSDATAGGVLSDALGAEGGSVKIRKLDGTYQEERSRYFDNDQSDRPV